MKNIRMTILASLMAATLGASLSAQSIVLQVGSNAPINSPWDLGLKKLASEWSSISGGRVKMVFPKSVANTSQEDLIQKLKFTLDGVILDTTGLGFIDGDIFFLSIPSVIRDDVEYEKAMSAALPLIRKKLGDRYEVVAMAKGGWIRFFSNQPLRTPTDLQQVRMGVSRNMESLTKLLQSMGVRTVKADSSSTLLQFNSGALDAMYSSPLFVAALWSQYRRVVTYISPFKVAPFFGAMVMNNRSWGRVPDSLKPALVASAERIFKEIGAEADRLEAAGIASMIKDGLIMPPFNADDQRAWDDLFTDTVKTVASQWYSPDFMAAIYAAIGR